MHLLDFADISPSPGRHGSHLSGNAATEGVHPLGIRQIFTILSSHHGMDDRAIQGDSVRRLFHNFVRPMFNFCMIHAIPLIFRAFRKKKKRVNRTKKKFFPFCKFVYTIFFVFLRKDSWSEKYLYDGIVSRSGNLSNICIQFFPLFCEREFFLRDESFPRYYILRFIPLYFYRRGE